MSHICAKNQPVSLTKTAGEWSFLLGINFNTVTARRHRGHNWSDALNPDFRQTPFNKSEVFPSKSAKKAKKLKKKECPSQMALF